MRFVLRIEKQITNSNIKIFLETLADSSDRNRFS